MNDTAIKYIPCPQCDGEGTQMEMRCYGGPPVEEYFPCAFCGGEGDFEESDYIVMKLAGEV